MEKKKLKSLLEERERVLAEVREDPKFYEFVTKLAEDIKGRTGTIFVMGNGGSMAQADHLVGELVGRYKTERRPYPAFLLGASGATLTAVANDYDYERVFERELEDHNESNNTLVALTTSGNSPNIVRALRSFWGTRFILTGKGGGQAAALGHSYIVPSNDTAVVQEVHQIMIHLVMEAVEC